MKMPIAGSIPMLNMPTIKPAIHANWIMNLRIMMVLERSSRGPASPLVGDSVAVVPGNNMDRDFIPIRVSPIPATAQGIIRAGVIHSPEERTA